MDRYDWYRLFLSLHLIAVVFGFGPAVAQSLLGLRARRAPIPARLPLTELVRDLGQRVFAPGGALVLVTGLVTAFIGDSDLRPFWVKAGIVLWLVLTALGTTLLLTARRMVAIQQSFTGPPSEDDIGMLGALGRRQGMLGGMTHLVLAITIVDMVWKPGS